MSTSILLRCLLITALLSGPIAPRVTAQIGDDAVVMEAYGAAVAVMLYNTYLAIGAIADGHGAAAYETATVVTLMDEQLSMIDKLTGNMEKVRAPDIFEESADRAYMDGVITIMRDMRKMAAALRAYVDGLAESDLNDYNAARSRAWEGIERLLEIKGDE